MHVLEKKQNEKLVGDGDIMLHTSLCVGKGVNGATCSPSGANWELQILKKETS